MKFNLVKSLFLVGIVAVMAFTSGCTRVEPGYAGIKVNMYGNQRGVEDFPIVTGRVWYNWFTEEVYEYPTFFQNVVWTRSKTEGSANDDSITFNSIEGAGMNADIALSYSFEFEKVPELFVEFRKDAAHITNVYMRSEVRDSFSRFASTMQATDIFGEGKQKLLQNVKEDLNTRLGPKGFKFNMVSFVGEIRVDDRVRDSINAVLQATQKAIEAENKIRQSQAEAEQAIAKANGEAQAILAVANAQAEANRTLAASISPGLISYKTVENWNGVSPLVVGGGGNGNTLAPFISIAPQANTKSQPKQNRPNPPAERQ